MSDIVCARCRTFVRSHECQGFSGIYSPRREFMLCERCFEEEDKLIDVMGTNDLPNEIERYKLNLRLGRR